MQKQVGELNECKFHPAMQLFATTTQSIVEAGGDNVALNSFLDRPLQGQCLQQIVPSCHKFAHDFKIEKPIKARCKSRLKSPIIIVFNVISLSRVWSWLELV